MILIHVDRTGPAPCPGLEVSGRISTVGEGVTHWQPSNEVYAPLTAGGYAQKFAVPQGQLLTVPKGVSLAQAAALPESTTTVWSNVFMTGGLKAGETFPVHSGAGDIGTTAVVSRPRAAKGPVLVPANRARSPDLGPLFQPSR